MRHSCDISSSDVFSCLPEKKHYTALLNINIFFCIILFSRNEVGSRKCENFVNKMWNFRHNCQLSQLEIRQALSVKRMIKSPGTKPVKKQQTEESTDLKPPTSMFRRQLQFIKTPLVELPKMDVQPYRNIQPKPCTPSLSALSVIEVQSFQSVAKPHLTTPTMTSKEIEHMSVYI